MKWTYKKLHVCRLSREGRARTCGYWYVVTCDVITAHTAFRTRKGLDQWLRRFGLKLARELQAGDGGCAIEGTYSRCYDRDRATLEARQGERIRVLDNGEYTTGVIQEDETGHRTVYLLGPNTDREIHPYAESLTIEYADWDDNEERACA